MRELCAYGPCRCVVAEDDMFCDDVCAMLGAGLVNTVRIDVDPLLEEPPATEPRCACGHSGCGETPASAEVH